MKPKRISPMFEGGMQTRRNCQFCRKVLPKTFKGNPWKKKVCPKCAGAKRIDFAVVLEPGLIYERIFSMMQKEISRMGR